MVERAGLKGRVIGGAQISSLHGNFIVNRGGATASNVLALIELAKEEVLKECGVELEEEVKIVGD